MTLSTTLKALSVGVGASLFLASGAHAQLDSALQEAKSATAAASAAQAQIDDLDDQASSAVRDFGAVIQQSDNLRLQVDQQDVVLASQRRELASVRRQLASVEQAKQGVIPMMLRMIVALEDSVAADIPFRITERNARLEDIKSLMADPDVSPAEQYRRILNAYEIETNYGYQVESYEGAHPSKPGNVVNFVRFGRSSWVYMSKDEGEIATYDLSIGDKGDWVPVTGGDAVAMRQAIRIANEEAAPGIVYAPVIKR